MAILDWFKEIPLSAVLKERITDLEKKVLMLEKENAALKEKNSKLNLKFEQSEEQRRNLEKQIIEIQNNPLKLTQTWKPSDPIAGY